MLRRFAPSPVAFAATGKTPVSLKSGAVWSALRFQSGSAYSGGSKFGGGTKDPYSQGYTRLPPQPPGVGKSRAMIGKTDWKEEAEVMPDFMGEQPPGVPPSDNFGKVGGRQAADFKFHAQKEFVVHRSARRAVPGLTDQGVPHEKLASGTEAEGAAHQQRASERIMPESKGFTRPIAPPPPTSFPPKFPGGIEERVSPAKRAARNQNLKSMEITQDILEDSMNPRMEATPRPPRSPPSPASNRFHDDAIPGHRNIMAPNEANPRIKETTQAQLPQMGMGAGSSPASGNGPDLDVLGSDPNPDSFDGPRSKDPKSVRFSVSAAAREETAHLKAPEFTSRGSGAALPRSMIDLDGELDEDALNSKLGAASTRDGALDEALGLQQPAQRRAVPRPRESRFTGPMSQLNEDYEKDGKREVVNPYGPGADPEKPSAAFQSITNPMYVGTSDEDGAIHRYDWFQNNMVRNVLFNMSSTKPPDTMTMPGMRMKPEKKSAIKEFKRLFEDFDWGDRSTTTHVLFLYPWGEMTLALLFFATIYFLYHYQIDNKYFDWYDEFLGFDFRMFPGIEAGMILMGTMYFTYVFGRHPLMIIGVITIRLSRLMRGKPIGPP